MTRQTLNALLALLVSVPVTRAIQSWVHALDTGATGAWATAVSDALVASLALSCAVALLALLDEKGQRTRMLPLLDWRAAIRARRIERSDAGTPASTGV